MAVFNREDGQLALGSKTPVSILQEILHKKGSNPHYELIYNGVCTPDPRFKFRVSAEGITAIGDGKSKKEAKHDAAASLLKRLLNNNLETQTTEVKEEVNIASPYTGALKTNYVGMLDDVCFLNKIPNPNYNLVREEGPPHARVFTMSCDLSSISEVAVARTKKQAKHLVAQKMIERVSIILKDRFIPPLENDEVQEDVVSDYEKIKNGTFHHDLTYRVGELHNVFHIQKDEEPLPSVFQELPEKPEEFYDSMEQPLLFLEELIIALEGVVKKNSHTWEEFQKSLEELVAFSEDDNVTPTGRDECEKQDELCASNGVIPHDILPDFPLSEDKEEIESGKTAGEKEGVLKTVEDFDKKFTVEDIVSKLKMANVEDVVYSFITVEVPRGLWDFVGRGRSDQEALDRAARKALKFFRTMAIPPM